MGPSNRVTTPSLLWSLSIVLPINVLWLSNVEHHSNYDESSSCGTLVPLQSMIISVECSIQPLDSLVSIQPPAIHSRPPLPQGISSLFKDTVFPRNQWRIPVANSHPVKLPTVLHKQVPYILCLLNLFCQAFIHLSWATKKCNNNKSKFQTVLSHLQ